MSAPAKAFIAGAYEHPGRELPGVSLAQLHAEVALGAVSDAGLSLSDVDGYFCAADAPGFGAISMADYLGLRLRHLDSTEMGGAAYVAHIGRAADAIAAGQCSVALITLAGLSRTQARARSVQTINTGAPEHSFEDLCGATIPARYAMAARRHMYEFGTTPAQLAEIRVAASLHAQHNPHAFMRNPVTVEEVLESPLVSDPLRRLDCCVVTDGGGALVVVSPEIARALGPRCVRILGQGVAPRPTDGGRLDVTRTAAVLSGPRAFAEAGLTPADVDYASIYDSFTITVLMTLEDLGFCEKGQGGRFVAEGNLRAPYGKLPFNTDGGGLCNNHPGNRGGMTKAIEAVRQLRGEAHRAVQVPDCEVAIVHGTGGHTRMACATVLLGGSS